MPIRIFWTGPIRPGSRPGIPSTGSSTFSVESTCSSGRVTSSRLKCSATFSASHSDRSFVHTKVSDTAEATRCSSQCTNWSHCGPGSPASMDCSASRIMLRSRSRRSCSMSEMRSLMPSLSVTCQREERRRSSSARSLAASSSASISGVPSGFSSALSSDFSESRK